MFGKIKTIVLLALAVLLVVPVMGCDAYSPVVEDLYFTTIHSVDGYFTNLYIGGVPVGDNVTGSGTAGRLTQWAGPASITDATNTNAQVVGAVAASHVQNTDIILTTDGATPLINAGVLTYDLKTDRWTLGTTNTLFGINVTGGVGVLTGARNTAYGNETMYDITTGNDNTAVGWRAARGLTTGEHNTAVGDQTLVALTTGIGNTAVGELALGSVTTGSFNTAVGTDALWQNTGLNNTVLGVFAGNANLTGSGNVFLGKEAGGNELGSNKLYIDNSDTATPLIYGDFSTNNVVINGNEQIVGTLDMNLHQINNVLNPAANQDAATKLYVDTAVAGGASGNVTTAGGTANYIPKFTSATNIANSIMSESGSTVTTAGIIQANTGIIPDAIDGAYLGTTTAQFSDLFLAEGGVINWDNGDATITQVGDVVTVAGADLKVTTPGNVSTSVITTDGTQTLTNKTLTSPNINEAVAMSVTSTNLNLVDDNDFIDVLTRRGVFPTDFNYYYGLVSAVTGSGSSWTLFDGATLRTGATASSTVVRSGRLSVTFVSGGLQSIDWSKRTVITFRCGRVSSDAQVYARFQLKTVDTEGILGAKGVGIELRNYAYYSDSYGTARGNVSFGANASDYGVDEIVIDCNQPAGTIKWYLNGVLKVTESTANNIPSGKADLWVVMSEINGVTGGTNCRFDVAGLQIYQDK